VKSKPSASLLSTHLLDTPAVIAYLAEETGADRVKAVRHTSAIPFIALSEVYYVTWREQSQALADQAIEEILTWRLPVLYPDQRVSLSAGYLKGRYHLGIADSFIAAAAIDSGITLVTKDPDFKVLSPDLKLLFLD
jgi:predicted nucleic acid-binding protein